MRVGRARPFWALWARFDRLLMAFCWENGLFWCRAGAGGAWRAIRGAHVVDDTHGGYGTGGSTRESPNERGRPPQRAHFALLRGRFQALLGRVNALPYTHSTTLYAYAAICPHYYSHGFQPSLATGFTGCLNNFGQTLRHTFQYASLKFCGKQTFLHIGVSYL